MSTSLVEGGIESCYPETKILPTMNMENAIILDECVYSHIWAAIRTSHAQNYYTPDEMHRVEPQASQRKQIRAICLAGDPCHEFRCLVHKIQH